MHLHNSSPAQPSPAQPSQISFTCIGDQANQIARVMILDSALQYSALLSLVGQPCMYVLSIGSQ